MRLILFLLLTVSMAAGWAQETAPGSGSQDRPPAAGAEGSRTQASAVRRTAGPRNGKPRVLKLKKQRVGPKLKRPRGS